MAVISNRGYNKAYNKSYNFKIPPPERFLKVSILQIFLAQKVL